MEALVVGGAMKRYNVTIKIKSKDDQSIIVEKISLEDILSICERLDLEHDEVNIEDIDDDIQELISSFNLTELDNTYPHFLKAYQDFMLKNKYVDNWVVLSIETEELSTRLYQLKLSMPFFRRKSRELILYEEWCKQYPMLIDTFRFMLGNLIEEKHKVVSATKQLEATWITMELSNEFTGYIVSLESYMELEEHIESDRFYTEDKYKFDFNNGTEYCVLEGGISITDKTKQFLCDKSSNMGILNLYKYPEKIKLLDKYKPSYIVVDTTLYDQEGISKLLEIVKTLQYTPKKVYFLNEVIPTSFKYEKVTFNC